MATNCQMQIVIVDHDLTDLGENPVTEVLSPTAILQDGKLCEAVTPSEMSTQEIYDEVKRLHF